jgi:hypothetical protein
VSGIGIAVKVSHIPVYRSDPEDSIRHFYRRSHSHLPSLDLSHRELGYQSLLGLFKQLFTHATFRASPILRKVGKGGAWANAVLRISCSRVIYVTADCAKVFVHGSLLSIRRIMSQKAFR